MGDTLTDTAAAVECPACGEPLPRAHAEADDSTLAAVRCMRCGRRWTRGGRLRPIQACERCGLPFVEARDEGPGGECPVCATFPAGERVEPELASAAAVELRAVLAGHLNFVGSDVLEAYLRDLARCVAQAMHTGSALEGPAVAVFEKAAVEALALPDGALVLSTGWLDACENEAELAFALGHEVAHLRSGVVLWRLAGAGLAAVARGAEPEAGWMEAAEGVVRFGYGDEAELAADARAAEALVGIGYDPHAALAWIARLDERVKAGDPAVAGWALAHPAASRRAKAVRTAAGARAAGAAQAKLNREVFRRVLERSRPWQPRVLPVGDRPSRSGTRLGWWLAGAALVGLGAALAWLAWTWFLR